jgi:hypothetical protein
MLRHKAHTDHGGGAAAFTWITVRGGDVTLAVSGQRNFPLDHSGCAAMLTWIMVAAPRCSHGSWWRRRNAHTDHGGGAAMLTWITVRGGGVTSVVSGRRRVRVDLSP